MGSGTLRIPMELTVGEVEKIVGWAVLEGVLELGTLEEREPEAIFWFEMKMDEEQRFL